MCSSDSAGEQIESRCDELPCPKQLNKKNKRGLTDLDRLASEQSLFMYAGFAMPRQPINWNRKEGAREKGGGGGGGRGRAGHGVWGRGVLNGVK